MTARLIALFLLFSLLVPMAMTGAEEDINSRLARFNQEYGRDQIAALEILKPCNHPKLVDALAMVFGDENTSTGQTYDAVYMMADRVFETVEGDDTVLRMHDYVTPNRQLRVRKHFAAGLGVERSPLSLPFLIKMAPVEKEEVIQFEMARSLCAYNDDDAFIALFKLCNKALSMTVSLQALRGLQAVKSESTTELLRKLYLGKAPNQIRGEAFNSLYERRDDLVDEELVKALSDRDTAVRVAAISIAVAEKREDLSDTFVSMLTAPEWEVRSAAIKACAELKIAKAIGPLIELWKVEPGRIGDDIHKALLKITGVSLGPDWRYWEAWYKNLAEPPKAGDKEGEYISYHGLQTKSKNIAFVVDRSGSMMEPVKSKTSGYVGDGAVVKDDTKMAFVKAELIRVIKSLPEDTVFNMVAFDSTVSVWKKEQTKAVKKSKEEAIRWVEALTPNGQTNVYDALVEAFGKMNPGGKPNTQYKEGGPDTIFLLTDGLPNNGTITNPPDILTAIATMNRVRQVTIHTIGVGKLCEPFLKPLAEQNHGVYKLIAE